MYHKLEGFCLALSCFWLSGCGALPTNAPSVYRHSIAHNVIGPTPTKASTCAIDNLKPDETTILTDGKKTSVSIDMTLSEPISAAKYVLEFSAGDHKWDPFIITTVGENGELEFSGTVSWYLRVYGESATVDMALYEVDQSDSGRTVTKTLVQEIRRTYQIECNKDECAMVLALKRWLGLCNCK
jgi:hypothetical protein